MSEHARLDPADIEAIAAAVAQKLRDEAVAPAQPSLIDAKEVARRFGVSADWARRNADRLGAVRIGHGSRPRLRFDADRVASSLRHRSGNDASTEDGSSSGPGQMGRGRLKKPKAIPGHLPRRSIELASLPEKDAPAAHERPGA